MATAPDWLTARPIAHRGLHDAANGLIENTAGAVGAAIDGRYGIEADLQISADGEAMVHHDDALGRLTDGVGALRDMSAAALKRVPFHATADRMMTLGDMLDLVAGRVTLVIELKSRFDGDLRLAARTAAVLARYPLAVWDLLKPAKRLELTFLLHVSKSRPGFLAYQVDNLTSVAPRAARMFGLPLLTWTVRSAHERAVAARFADQMIFEGFRA